MEYAKLIKERYSVRQFQEKAVEQEKIDAILQMVQTAPTATNAQPQHIFVLQSQTALQKLKECTKSHFHAPLAFLVCYDKTKSWVRGYDRTEQGTIDAAIVGTHLMLAITNTGLGSTWVGSFDPAKVTELYSLPSRMVPVAIFPTGYIAEGSTPNERHTQRLPLSETVTYL